MMIREIMNAFQSQRRAARLPEEGRSIFQDADYMSPLPANAQANAQHLIQ